MARAATVIAALSAAALCKGCGGLLGANSNDCLQKQELLYGAESLRAQHAYVCCNNQKWAEPSGSLLSSTLFSDVQPSTTFYDAKCGVELFHLGARPLKAWKEESRAHGWPSFRDTEVVQLGTNVIQRAGGEIVSSCGTHLGHNLPDSAGNRYCINLLCIAGHPAQRQLAMTNVTSHGLRNDFSFS